MLRIVDLDLLGWRRTRNERKKSWPHLTLLPAIILKRRSSTNKTTSELNCLQLCVKHFGDSMCASKATRVYFLLFVVLTPTFNQETCLSQFLRMAENPLQSRLLDYLRERFKANTWLNKNWRLFCRNCSTNRYFKKITNERFQIWNSRQRVDCIRTAI